MKINSLLHLGENKLRRTLDQVGEFTTIIGAESALTGSFKGKDNYLVYGRVEGECDLEGAVMLGEGGCWVGNIVAHHVFIAGEVEGDITAHGKIELLASARIRGHLTSPVIAMAEGAAFDGEIKMEKQSQVTSYSERRKS